MLTYVGTRHTCRRLSLNETATAFQADRVAFCKQTDFNGGPYRPLHDGGVGAGSQPTRSLPGESVLRGFAGRGALEGYPSHYTSLGQGIWFYFDTNMRAKKFRCGNFPLFRCICDIKSRRQLNKQANTKMLVLNCWWTPAFCFGLLFNNGH